MAKTKRTIRSPRLKRWLSVVKKHGGDMAAAAQEWRASGANPRRAKGLMPAHQRRAVVRGLARSAARELGMRNQLTYPYAHWRDPFVAAVGKEPKVRKAVPGTPAYARVTAGGAAGKGSTWEAAIAAAAVVPRKSRKKARKGMAKKKAAKGHKKSRSKAANVLALPGTAEWRRRRARGILETAGAMGLRNITPGAWKSRWSRATGIALNPVGSAAWRASLVSGLRRAGASPEFIGKVREGLEERAARNTMNALALNEAPIVATFKSLVGADALKDYGFVGVGFVAGAVLPILVQKGLSKVGILKGSPGLVVQALLGLGSSLVAGVATGAITKDAKRAQQVAAGGLAGVVGGLIVQQLERLMPMAGLGQAADDVVQRAVEAELQRELGPGAAGLGQFVTESDVERELAGMAGSEMGQFVTASEVEEAPVVAGMGSEAGEDIEEVADAFGYVD